MASKPLEDKATGIHRAKTWEVALFAMNNTSTNTYMMLVGSISYFLVGIVGIGAVLAGTVVTLMRIWDGVTDPFVGMMVDNTNTKFGKNRPYIVIGEIILFATTFIMFNFIPQMNTSIRFVAFIIIYMIYILGYTCQCVVTKSAQSCLTNDPQQRPLFASFDGVYNILLMSIFWPVYLSSTMVPKYTLNTATAADQISALIAQNPNLANVLTTAADGTQTLSGLYNPALWQSAQLTCGLLAAVLAICGIIGISRKDNIKYFGLGKAARVSFRDYADILAHNRGIQMLVVAASSDKLAMSMTSNASVLVGLYGIILGNYALQGSVSAITGVPIALISAYAVARVAGKMGQKSCLLVGTYGSLISAAALCVVILVGRGGNMAMPTFQLLQLSTYGNLVNPANWSFLGLLFVLLYIAMKTFSNLSGNIVIPMTADCADYEVYRTKRYVPGLMGTLFSFVDKLISSLATTIVAAVFALIGYTSTLPTPEDPYSNGIMICTLACFLGAPVIGWILNVIAMKFYPLTKEYMAEIQDEIAKIKAQSTKA